MTNLCAKRILDCTESKDLLKTPISMKDCEIDQLDHEKTKEQRVETWGDETET